MGHKSNRLKSADAPSLSPKNHKKSHMRMTENSHINHHLHSSNKFHFTNTPVSHNGRLIQDQKLIKKNTNEIQKDDIKVHFTIKDSDKIISPSKNGFSGKKGVAGPGNFRYRFQNIYSSKLLNKKADILKKQI